MANWKRAGLALLMLVGVNSVWASGGEQYWFAKAGMLSINKPAMSPLSAGALSYGYNINRNASFELDVMKSTGGGNADTGNASVELVSTGGFIAQRTMASRYAYFKSKIGAVLMDRSYSGDLSSESSTGLRVVPGFGAGALFHDALFTRMIIEAEVSYVDSEAYLATVGLHVKF
jgi:hypothetical protein